MRTTFKKIVSSLLVVVMLVGMLPMTIPTTTASAAGFDGKPDMSDMSDNLYLAIYKGQGFPGEPAVHSYTNYTNIGADFSTKFYGVFSSDASEQLSSDILNHLKRGISIGSTKVWGVYDAQGMKSYFKPGASIIKPENEEKIIKAIKGENVNPDDYEIIWYVIKYQSTDGWHIDGVIKEKATYSVNYYGNGNTEGSAPTGEVGISKGGSHTVLNGNGLRQVIDGLESEFLGWNTSPDGTGTHYNVGDKITNISSNISLYAQWKSHPGFTATVKTYLDDVLLDADDIHEHGITLLLGGETNNSDFIELVRKNEGTYVADNLKNGTYYIWHKDPDGSYHRLQTYMLVVQNEEAELHIYHYSVSYDTNGGSFEVNEDPGSQNYFKGTSVDAAEYIPVREGYIFKGWSYNGKTIDLSANITTSINEKVVLEAIWIKTVDVTVNVTIDHQTGTSYNEGATDDLDVYLTHLPEGATDYVRQGSVIQFTGSSTPGYTLTETRHDNGDLLVSTYKANTATFKGLPGDAEYSIYTSKTGYKVVSVTETQDSDGNWTIDVVVKYHPDRFDLKFSVKMFEDVPKALWPTAVNVKISYWSSADNDWVYIHEHEGHSSGIRVEIDPNTGIGYGSSPVFSHEADEVTPYGYRIEVVNFIYADGTSKHANESTPNVVYSDGNYSAEIQDVTGGKQFGTLYGAYYNDSTGIQAGDLVALISIEIYDVIFDAQGGKVNGKDTDIAKDQYFIPSFSEYVPTRQGYTFMGWYLDEACTVPAKENTLLVENVTLYAKWKAIQTISGKVTVAGSYLLGGNIVDIWASDRPTELTVLLLEVGSEAVGAIASARLNIVWNESTKLGTTEAYSFTGLDEDKQYRIKVLVKNYSEAYQNETTVITDDGNIVNDYNENDYEAVFVSDRTNTFVNSYLAFEPDNYEQEIEVDSSAINEGFRPDSTLVELDYKVMGEDDSFFKIISQHTVNGISIALGNDGKNKVVVTERVWKWNTDGAHYVYQAKLVSSTFGDRDEIYTDGLPYTVSYGYAAQWNRATSAPTGPVYVYLTPNTYKVTYDLNTDDVVTGMDDYLYMTGEYAEDYVWSFGLDIKAKPERHGYIFEGWYPESGASEPVTSIDPAMHEDITLVAKWSEDESVTKEVSYTVNHIIINDDGEKTKDSDTYTNTVWVHADNTIVIKEGSLVEKYYPGYMFDVIKPDVKEGDTVSSETVINIYYVVNEKDTENLGYTVEHIVDGIVKDRVVVTEDVWLGSDEMKITVTADSLKLNEYVGYKHDVSLSTDVGAGDKIDNGTVIKIVYVKDLEQTKTVKYYVHHNVAGTVKDIVAYEKTVWVNDTTLEIQDGTYTPKSYTGYEFSNADKNYAVGTPVEDETVITLYYVRDDDQKKQVNYTVNHVLVNDGKNIVTTKTYTDNIWVLDEDNIVIKDGSLALNTYTGYMFDVISPDVEEGDTVSSGTVINIYYVVNEEDTVTLKYTVKHIINNVVMAELVVYEPVWSGEANKKITVTEESLALNTYVGYKYDAASSTDVDAGDKLDDNAVIEIVYVKDETQTKTLEYYVHHYISGRVAHVDVYEEIVWINDDTLKIQSGTYTPRTYAGYAFSYADKSFSIGADVEDGTVITLYYIPDYTQQKTISYTVQHVVEGQVVDSTTYSDKVWILATFLDIKEGSLDKNTYEGYKFDSINTSLVEGDPVKAGTVITLTYVKDETQTHTLGYTVEHIVNGILRDTVKFSANVWVGSNTLAVDVNTYVAKTYTGYKFDYAAPVYAIGAQIEDGTVIKMYYISDESEVKHVYYVVHHNVNGEIVDSDEYVDTVWVNSDSVIEIQNGTYEPNVYVGYKYDHASVEYEVGEEVESGTEITLYYVVDNDATKDLSYTVNHVVNGVIKDTVVFTEKVWINSADMLTVQAGTYDKKSYTGYKFANADVEIPVGEAIANGTVINLYYEKDDEATKDLSYTVEHVVIDSVKDTVIFVEKVWVNAGNTLKVQNGTFTPKTYVGYKYSHTDSDLKVGDEIEDGAVIRLYYVKDDEATKDLSYTVEHVVIGSVKDTVLFVEKVWINAGNTLKVQDGTFTPKTYVGYKYSHTDSDLKVGDEIENGSVIRLYYVKDSFNYTVEYYFDGVKDSSLTVTNKAELDAVITEYEDKVKNGYVFAKTEGLPLTITADTDKNVIKVFYVLEDVENENPDTNDSIISALAAAMLPVIGIVVLSVTSKKKRIAE